jgi:hypothetical protein
MSADRYRELRPEMRCRGWALGLAIRCLIDHAAAIGTYEERLATEPDAEIRAIMARAQATEFRNFACDLEYLLQANPEWRAAIEDAVAQTRPSPGFVARGTAG